MVEIDIFVFINKREIVEYLLFGSCLTLNLLKPSALETHHQPDLLKCLIPQRLVDEKLIFLFN